MTTLRARARGSLAYRFGTLARTLLAMRSPRYPIGRPTNDCEVLTFAGAPYRLMVEQFLYSLAMSWSTLPRVAIALNRDEDRASFEDLARVWPGSLELVSPSQVRDRLEGHGLDDLLTFAEREAMGRKLAAVAARAFDGRLLYADVDVLWFGDGSQLYGFDRGGEAELVASEDYQAAYDARLVPTRMPSLARAPFLCAGFLLVRGDFLRAAGMESFLEFLAENGVFFSEQTVVAEAVHRLGRVTFPRTLVYSGEADKLSLAPTYLGKGWIARHYVSPSRHLLWRDALALRCGAGRIKAAR